MVDECEKFFNKYDCRGCEHYECCFFKGFAILMGCQEVIRKIELSSFFILNDDSETELSNDDLPF